jgi:hypothetical protein
VVSYYIAYHSAVGFLWPSTFGLAATIIVGLVAAAIRPAPSDSPGRKLTWRAVLATPVA